MNSQPPRWVDRFLSWYCNPDLLEEIQGDAHELYFERVSREGKRSANLKYAWDVLRFFRWSNIKRSENVYTPGSFGAVWNLNFKMTVRNASKNKLVFAVKIIGLSICLAFALLLTAFVVNEMTFDRFHANSDRIYRIAFKINFNGQVNAYAVGPLPVGQALADEIPEIDNYFRFIYEEKPIFHIRDEVYYNDLTLAADSNFLKILTFEFVQGNRHALDEPDKIVLTEALAQKFFGDQNPIGQTVEFGQGLSLEVAAVIKNVPSNSHLKFNALISWDTFDRNEAWGNMNAYTYVLLKPDANIQEVTKKAITVLDTFHEQIIREYKATIEPVFEKITDVHFSGTLNEDIAEKRSVGILFTLIAVVILFLTTGLINYLNLTLAELTANLRKIGIVRVFGGMGEGHRKMLAAETTFALVIVLPLTFLLSYLGWVLAYSRLGIQIDHHIFLSPLFLFITSGFLIVLLASTYVNSYVLSKTSHVVDTLKGKTSPLQLGLPIRKLLVAAQLSFSIIVIALIIVIVDQFRFIEKTDKGFDDRNTIVVKLRSNEPSRVRPFNEELRRINGVSKVEGSTYYPGVIEMKYVFQIETEKGTEQRLVSMMHCGYDYLDALSIKMAKGREFSVSREDDRNHAFIINETAARAFGWKDPIGKKIGGPVSGNGEASREGEVIGVAKDFNFASLHSRIEPLIIFPTDESWGNHFIYIKTHPVHSRDLVASIEREFKKQWPEYPFEWEYLDAKYLSLYKGDYQIKIIFEIGLVITILVSCLAIFSVSALMIAMRTKEMGIRKVVGATSIQLFFLHTKTFLQYLVVAILISWPLIWLLSGMWLQNFAYHIQLNIWYFILPGMSALVITLIISGYHGIKGAMISPVDTLKHE